VPLQPARAAASAVRSFATVVGLSAMLNNLFEVEQAAVVRLGVSVAINKHQLVNATATIPEFADQHGSAGLPILVGASNVQKIGAFLRRHQCRLSSERLSRRYHNFDDRFDINSVAG
jgi:hypothetical protein